MATLMPVAKQQFFIPGTAIPLVDGKLYTYAAGTSTPKATFQDPGGITPCTNPITLDSTGSALIYWDGSYKVVVKDAFGGTVYTVDNYTDTASTFKGSGGASLIGFLQGGTGAVASTVQDELRRTVWVDSFGTDTAAFDKAIAAVGNGGVINLRPGGTYLLSSTWKFPTTSKGIIINGNGATIIANHISDGIDITSLNENYGGHIFRALTVSGPNVHYPMSAAELAGTSLGAGLTMGGDNSNTVSAYQSEFYSCYFFGFKKGISMQAAIWCKFFGGGARWNQYGIYIDGGQTNANAWYGFIVRENRVRGMYSTGNTSGSLTNATANLFHGGGFETNIPYRGDNPAGYSGGYPTAMDRSGLGVGVMLSNSYDFIFDGTYFENQNYSIVINGSSDNITVTKCRLAPGGNRIGGILLDSSGTNVNTVSFCTMICADATTPNVEVGSSSQSNNQFLDNEGFNFIVASILKMPFIRNNRKNQQGGGMNFGAMAMPQQGYVQNPSEGTTQGTIQGIGTTTAILHAFGIGEVEFSTQITSDTKITAISDMVPGQFMTIRNYQTSHSVTIVSSLFDYGDLILKNNRSVVLNKFGQELILYCNGQGKVYEHGRNFSDQLCGEVNIVDANTSATITFANPEKDALYFPIVSAGAITAGAPAAAAYTVHISNKTAAGFNIILGAAPGVGTGLNFEWLAAR